MSQKTSLDKNKINVLLLEGIHPNAENLFKKSGYTNVSTLKSSLTGADLIEAIKDVHFLGIRSRTQITDDVIQNASKLAGIGCFCIGTNQVDLESSRLAGIPVFNAPFANTRSVAELVLGEIILLLRGIPGKNAAAHRGEWIKSAAGSFETRGKTLGIVGYGHIGTQLGILAENLGMNVQFYDIENKLALGNANAAESFDALLASSDVVSFHVPETPETRFMMNAEKIALMKPGSFLVNASRGTVVDIDALAVALKEEHIAGAAIDVFPVEPKSNNDEFQSPLRGLDNVILTPHVGGSTQEAQANIGIEVAEKLVKYSDNGSTVMSVNFPEVSLPSHAGQHRICHIHRNEPGVLSCINDIFSRRKINVTGQYLQTRDQIGYVVTDVEKLDTDAVIEELKAVTGTLKVRILY